MSSLELLPALDIWNGAVMRTNDDISPFTLVDQWKSEGSQWVHLVDMNRALREGENSDLVTELIKYTSLKVELAGGMTSSKDIEDGLVAGATRVNIASQALENLNHVKEMIEHYGQKVGVCLDIDDGYIMPRGSGKKIGPLDYFLDELEGSGFTSYIVTDVAKDGSLQGPSYELIRYISERTENPLISSGGVAQLTDIETLKEYKSYGLEGVILGKALHTHKFSLSQALAVSQAPSAFGK